MVTVNDDADHDLSCRGSDADEDVTYKSGVKFLIVRLNIVL